MAFDRHVLKTVVQNDEPGVKFFHGPFARSGAVRVHHHMGLAVLCCEHERFVACFFCQCARFDEIWVGNGFGLVAAGQEQGFDVVLLGPVKQPSGHRGLAGAAPADVADRDGQGLGFP